MLCCRADKAWRVRQGRRLDQLCAVAEGGQHGNQIARITAASQFADRVHGKGRCADVDGAYAQAARSDRADGATAAHVTAYDERLDRDVCTGAKVAEERSSFAVGGVALVAVDFDDRAGVELGAMVFVMLHGKVRVHGVGVVR